MLDAGFTHRGAAGGMGFAAGGVLDTMAACGKLAVAAGLAAGRVDQPKAHAQRPDHHHQTRNLPRVTTVRRATSGV